MPTFDVVNRLDEILKPQYLGWEIPKYDKQSSDKKIVVYNHRPHTYKNWPWVLKQMDKLWEERQDFELWVPLADTGRSNCSGIRGRSERPRAITRTLTS